MKNTLLNFFINNGGNNSTKLMINALAVAYKNVKNFSFTGNFFHELALFAGLKHITGDVIIPIGLDLLVPIEVTPFLIEEWQAGADIVLAKRAIHLKLAQSASCSSLMSANL